jgi:cob(I)alamin adenosyltransferase
VEIPNEFILPGDSPTGAAISIARAVVRRAERHIARLIHEDQIESRILLIYLNRLSSLLFILELRENEIFGKSTPTLARKK